MLFTASTVKESAESMRFFVAANLASGVDHLVVFLDAPESEGQQQILEELESHPHVTPVPTDRDWWRRDRPPRLNVRQRINANVVVSLLGDVPGAEWVVHLDGDEVLQVDATALAACPRDTKAVWFAPLEAVSTPDAEQRPTLFKRLLAEDELQLLTVLGVLESPSNRDYFHGHVLGKSGVRPGAGLHLTLHDSVHPDGRRLSAPERFEHPDLRLLHYDAVSGEAFVRKWQSMIAAGPVSLRPDRAPLAMALRSLIGKDLAPEVAATYLREIYARTTQDAVDTLSDLRLLEQLDPLTGSRRPAEMPLATAAALARELDTVREAPKRPFHVNHADPAAPPAGRTLVEGMGLGMGRALDRTRRRWRDRG